MADWNRDVVEARIQEAADVLKRLPEERVRGFFNTWPDMMVEFSDMVGRAGEPMKRPPPHPGAISRMEETLTWSKYLEPDDARLLWARADGMPWKHVCWRFGMARATAHRRYDYALCLIAWQLNGRQPPRKRSRGFVVERVRSLSR
ncbi:DUF6362 family protein [Aquamicrobium terrae]|uniref:DUF6362 domain-containing protein n=1 Tax=Aquamicrobium terrae TaxID=1324945 RepID=A0ABV2MYB1_9HYPH